MKTLPPILSAFVALLPGPARSEGIPGQLFEHVPQRAWLENYDPTLISGRWLSEFIFESYDDNEVLKIENTLRWGIPVKDDLAAGFQMMLPVKWNDAPGADDFGLGNIEARTGLVGRLAPDLRWGLGVNAEFDTATADSLGGGAFVLRPMAVIRWDITDRVNLGMNVEYSVTPFDEDDADVSALELKFPVAFKINECWSGFVSYNPRRDLLAESDRHRLEAGLTRLFGDEDNYALSFVGEVPLTSEDFHFKLAAGFSWFF